MYDVDMGIKYTGIVAGVEFKDGKGTTNAEWTVEYFEKQGFKVTKRKGKANNNDNDSDE